MTVSNISWYLCLLFAVALALSSLMTVAPEGQGWMRLEMGAWLALSILFATAAVGLRVFHLPQPVWLLRLFQCMAVLATVAIALMAGG